MNKATKPKKDKIIEINKDNSSKNKSEKVVKIIDIVIVLFFALILTVVIVFLFRLNEQKNQVANPVSFEETYNRTKNGYETESNYEYNGFIFVKGANKVWKTIVLQKFKSGDKIIQREVFLSTFYGPKELEYVPVEKSSLNVFRNDIIYTSFKESNNSMYAIAGLEIRKIVGENSSIIKKNMQTAVYGNNNSFYPQISCNDTSASNTNLTVGVIEFRIGNETSIKGNSTCTILTAKNDDELVAVADRYLFKILKIME